MLEMNYTNDRYTKVLDKGNYKGFDYAIISYGTHPCCYVFLPRGHKYYGKSYDEINIDCHGGLTYAEDDLSSNPIVTDKWVIGWDYHHCDDYSGLYKTEYLKLLNSGKELMDSFAKMNEGVKKWTTQELLQEVKEVIEQL